jgi:hypothetical protein
MASLIKTNKISTPGGEEFTLPTTYPGSQSSLTSTSGGVLGYGSLGFSSDVMSSDNKVINTNAGTFFESNVQSGSLVDKARIKNDSTATAVTLDIVPSLRTGQVAANAQLVTLHFCGVCFADQNFYPTIQLLDSGNNNVISNSNANQAMRYYHNSGGSFNNQSKDPNVAYMSLLYNESIRPCGASASSELFNQTSLRNGTAMMNGYVKMMIISSDANSDTDTSSSRFGAGGLILSENYLAYRYSSSYSSNNSNSIVGVFGQYVSKQQTLNNPTKIKFYSHTGSTVMNEGLFWTETIMNPGKTT